jgi:hypothetical protein
MSQFEHAKLYGDPYKYSSAANSLPPPRKEAILAAPMGIVVGYCEGVNEHSEFHKRHVI